MNLSDYKISTKLIASFVVVALFSLVIGLQGLSNTANINESTVQLYEKEMLGLSYMKESNIDLLYIGRSARNALLATTDEARAKALEKVKADVALTKQNMEAARPLFWSEKGRAEFAKLDEHWKAYEPVLNGLVEKIKASKLDTNAEAADYLFKTFGPAVNKVDDQMTALTKVKEANSEKLIKANAERYTSSRNWAIALIVLSLGLGVGLGLLISRNVTQSLGRAMASAQRMSEGDMSQPIETAGRDETAQLAQTLESMRQTLAGIVGNVRSNAESVATASSQIAQGNSDLSQRTEQQASALEETAATMDELGSTVRNNADNSQQANQLAMNASDVATQGGAVVSQVVETMRGINDSSKKITDIITVIDGIAFQTNILALNAAVEAARAGEQGRGFAVVASEVRSLAQRSAEAAKEIKALIAASVERVEQGTGLVDEAGKTMHEIVGAIKRVTDIVGEISSASREQSTGVSQIGEAITQMDQVTQQNAALVEESAAAAESLRQQARQLVDAMAFFKVAR
ncbi:methyl-accepting chemotaxis protein [Paucibacter oligotrophus]|uniref:Methyl-accepting chemotaxis protein n=1 Tax=Roseateles oligotrophus TaxID=1769250 RepID=A0A840LGU2_9BURK|nr:methyl-accepting chemotaxis protein [Roseateles oligotrophus]MBB4845438.1 methyl-accepting chemotaxis protein [Roseateles oligotrophus]